jgi:hypothetical protein
LARRLLAGAVDVVSDRAPWLSDQAYRVVAAPLQWVDPAGGARTAEARLDDVRDRVIGMAVRGRLGRAEQRHIQRDLTRTREDLERIIPRLPTVQARGLALRLAAYTEVLGALPGGPMAKGRSRSARPPSSARSPSWARSFRSARSARSARSFRSARSARSPSWARSARSRDAVVLTGAAGVAAGGWAGVLLPVAGSTAAVEGGLAAGVVTALGVTALRNRRTRKARIGALADALAMVDEATRGPNGVDLRGLDRDRHALLRRAWGSARLDERGVQILRRINAHLDDLLIRLLEGDLEADAAHLVQATVTRYLPDTLEPFLALADPRAVVRGRPAAVEVADQLASIESSLAEAARRPARNRPETLLLLQGEFLRSKFGEPSTWRSAT